MYHMDNNRRGYTVEFADQIAWQPLPLLAKLFVNNLVPDNRDVVFILFYKSHDKIFEGNMPFFPQHSCAFPFRRRGAVKKLYQFLSFPEKIGNNLG